MKIIRKINAGFILDSEIYSLESISTNRQLEGLIFTIRRYLGDKKFSSQENIDAYFKASILVFNNLNAPYWEIPKKGGILGDDYFRQKLDLIIDSKESVINQLIDLWVSNKVTNIEYNLRGLEVILDRNLHELGDYIVKLIVKALKPLIDEVESML